MKKAVNLYFFNGNTKEKLDNIKQTGFDGVFLSVDDKNETMTLEEQVEYCKKIGLGISMIHCSYIEPKLNDLWVENSENGDYIEKDLLDQIKRIKNLGVKNFVIHTNGGFDVKNTRFGLKRIKNLLKTCEKYDIHLCIENLYVAEQVEYIFKNLKSKNLKFCYDCGHENFLTPNCDLVEKYHTILTVTHLHDNHGSKDEHLTLGEGTIDQTRLAQLLATANFEYLSAEIKVKDKEISQIKILKDNFNALKKLDRLIQIAREKTV